LRTKLAPEVFRLSHVVPGRLVEHDVLALSALLEPARLIARWCFPPRSV
jgi:hypothetical protein